MNELGLPYSAIKDTITGQSRWSTQHEIIFSYDSKFYKAHYQHGSTESQDEGPWEYDNGEIECTEVQLVERTVKIWEVI